MVRLAVRPSASASVSANTRKELGWRVSTFVVDVRCSSEADGRCRPEGVIRRHSCYHVRPTTPWLKAAIRLAHRAHALLPSPGMVSAPPTCFRSAGHPTLPTPFSQRRQNDSNNALHLPVESVLADQHQRLSSKPPRRTRLPTALTAFALSRDQPTSFDIFSSARMRSRIERSSGATSWPSGIENRSSNLSL